jgi:dinuclear metal center YbgI/SA1388 family protein
MTTISQVCHYLNQQFPLGQAEDFDNVGLLCGRPETPLEGIMICHDALEAVIDEAIAKQCNLVVCFHPIIFSGLKKITGKTYVERAVLKAIEHKIAIYAIHTAMDNHPNGVNKGLGLALGLSDLKILSPKQKQLKSLEVYVPSADAPSLKQALFEAGAGHIGNYSHCAFTWQGEGSFKPEAGAQPVLGEFEQINHVDETLVRVIFEDYKQGQILAAMYQNHPYEEVAYQILSLDNANQHAGLGMYGLLPEPLDELEFLTLVKQKLNLPIIRHSDFINKKIQKVGILGGSGAYAIGQAKALQCDAYLSADFKYHDFFAAENQILLGDIGHFESEQMVISQIYEIICQKFSNFVVLNTSVETNPVKYFI